MNWWNSLPPAIKQMIAVRACALAYLQSNQGGNWFAPTIHNDGNMIVWPSDLSLQANYCRAYLELLEFAKEKR